RANAVARGDRRRAATLAVRGTRIEGEVEATAENLRAARASARSRRRVGSGRADAHERLTEHAAFLDRQARLPALRARASSRPGPSRDYEALAALAGYGSEEYRRLTPLRKRTLRREIDRELALRTEAAAMSTDPPPAPKPSSRRAERTARAGAERELAARM